MRYHYDEETDILTEYYFWIEGIQVGLNDSWCPGAPISLHRQMMQGGIELLYTTVDCAKDLRWTPPTVEYLGNAIGIGYWVDGYIRYEMLASDEIATRVVYDGQNMAHIAVTHTLSIGTSTVWLEGKRFQYYGSSFNVDVRFCVEFGNSEECTRFIHEDMRKLEHQYLYANRSDVGVIDDMVRALSPIWADHATAMRKAAQRSVPYSQFADELPQPEMQLIRHRASNRGNDRPCFLTLHLSTRSLFYITRVDWSATSIPSTFPSPSGTFQSLNNLYLKFPSHASHDRDHDSTSRSRHEDLTISIYAREISFSTGTDSVSLGNGFTLSSTHRTINVNYINAIMGDAFLAPINGGNVGGRSNVNTIRVSSPVGSR